MRDRRASCNCNKRGGSRVGVRRRRRRHPTSSRIERRTAPQIATKAGEDTKTKTKVLPWRLGALAVWLFEAACPPIPSRNRQTAKPPQTPEEKVAWRLGGLALRSCMPSDIVSEQTNRQAAADARREGGLAAWRFGSSKLQSPPLPTRNRENRQAAADARRDVLGDGCVGLTGRRPRPGSPFPRPCRSVRARCRRSRSCRAGG